MENPTATIQCHIRTEREKRIKENPKLLQLIAKAVLYCGRQCIALRGDKERLDQPGNPKSVNPSFFAFLAIVYHYLSAWQVLKKLCVGTFGCELL